MKVKKHEAIEEKRILIAIIVNDAVCGRIADKWKTDGLFRVRWANVVAGWCVRYYRRYRTAPRADIEGLFTAWAATATDKATVELVDRFLSGLSGEYEEAAADINPEYVVDMAGEYFNAVQLENMAEAVQGFVQTGNVAEAIKTVGKWDRVEMGTGSGVDVFQDEAAIKAAFEADTEALITYPGDLGKFFGNQLARDEFVAITGATGRGKTWWLMDIAWMGVRQKKKVAFFEVGDMSQNQIMRRIMCRATGRPLKAPFDIEVPTEIIRENGDDMATVITETKSFPGPLQASEAWEMCQNRFARAKVPLLRLGVYPNSSINVDGIISTLNVWERQGWVPDVIVIDYADILAAPTGYTPGDREAINATWKALRSLSQSRHCLVVTATQGDANSYNAGTISRSNFSDDRRKNDHVTGMLGINANEGEQSMGIFRLNWTKRREEAYTESRCVHVAGCLAIGRPHIKSTF